MFSLLMYALLVINPSKAVLEDVAYVPGRGTKTPQTLHAVAIEQ